MYHIHSGESQHEPTILRDLGPSAASWDGPSAASESFVRRLLIWAPVLLWMTSLAQVLFSLAITAVLHQPMCLCSLHNVHVAKPRVACGGEFQCVDLWITLGFIRERRASGQRARKAKAARTILQYSRRKLRTHRLNLPVKSLLEPPLLCLPLFRIAIPSVRIHFNHHFAKGFDAHVSLILVHVLIENFWRIRRRSAS